ncbi:MAG: hypothetical protein WKF35_10300 [Ferruginibacter sp.]
MEVSTLLHIYPSFNSIQAKIENGFNLTAEEELLHCVSVGEFDKLKAQNMLQEWFPKENFSTII